MRRGRKRILGHDARVGVDGCKGWVAVFVGSRPEHAGCGVHAHAVAVSWNVPALQLPAAHVVLDDSARLAVSSVFCSDVLVVDEYMTAIHNHGIRVGDLLLG